ncbi:MAG: hypothetical protein MJ245_02990 [Clostridia bacterium]|nr:hypothetical protein [Clostridia bacterium]
MKLDCVYYDGSSYLCIQDSYDEIPPSENTSKWVVIAKGAKWAEMSEAEKSEATRMTLAALSEMGQLQIDRIDTSEVNIDGLDVASKLKDHEDRIQYLEDYGGGGGGGSLPPKDAQWIRNAEAKIDVDTNDVKFNTPIRIQETDSVTFVLREDSLEMKYKDEYEQYNTVIDSGELNLHYENEDDTNNSIMMDVSSSAYIGLNGTYIKEQDGYLQTSPLDVKGSLKCNSITVSGSNPMVRIGNLENKFVKLTQAQYDQMEEDGQIDENKIYFIIEEASPMMISEPVFSPMMDGIAPIIERFDCPLDEDPVIKETEGEETQEND